MAANQTDTLQEQIAVLTAKVKQQEFRVADLQRKSRGTTRANRVVAEHQRQLAALREQITAIQDRLAKLGDNASAAQAMAFTDEAKRIDARVDSLWTDLNAQLTELAGRVDQHDATLTTHGADIERAHSRLDGHDGLFEELSGRVVIVGEATASAHARIDVLQRHVLGIPAWVYAVGGGIGLVAFFLWLAGDWTQTVTVGEAEAEVVNTYANTLWAAVLAGLSIATLAIALLGAIFRESVDTTASAEADAAAETRSTTAPPADRTTRPTHNSNGQDNTVQQADAAPPTRSAEASANASTST